MKTELYYSGKYKAAGVWYSERDLFGYPDTLIRGRVDAAYRFGCNLVESVIGDKRVTVIDIGSCHGHGVRTIREKLRPVDLISFDRWFGFLYAQRSGFQINGFDPSGIDFVTGRLPYLPFKDKSIDVVFLMHVIEHLPKLNDQLREIRRVMKERGVLVIATPNKNNLVWRNPDDLTNFDSGSLRSALEESGFCDIKVYGIAGDDRAMKVHMQKRFLAKHFPLSDKLRKKIPWRLWDRWVLHAGLSWENFKYVQLDNSNASNNIIDLLAVVRS